MKKDKYIAHLHDTLRANYSYDVRVEISTEEKVFQALMPMVNLVYLQHRMIKVLERKVRKLENGL